MNNNYSNYSNKNENNDDDDNYIEDSKNFVFKPIRIMTAMMIVVKIHTYLTGLVHQ